MRSVMSFYNEYVHYLMDMVDSPKNYWLLFNELLRIDFIVHTDTKELSMDSNRSSDGLRLRDIFVEENVPESLEGEFRANLGYSSSVLEMMIALCDRMERHVSDRSKEELFWEMLENLGIDDYTDEILDKEDSYYENLIFVFDKFNSREYRKDGQGGNIFVVPESKVDEENFDFRKMEIWRQANFYCRVKEGDFG